uniref:Uncharacterized protein n=1 Tax=Rhizophora mucronata TaxID=61149 RepID=A0A2P2QJA6_RHIMU
MDNDRENESCVIARLYQSVLRPFFFSFSFWVW